MRSRKNVSQMMSDSQPHQYRPISRISPTVFADRVPLLAILFNFFSSHVFFNPDILQVQVPEHARNDFSCPTALWIPERFSCSAGTSH